MHRSTSVVFAIVVAAAVVLLIWKTSSGRVSHTVRAQDTPAASASANAAPADDDAAPSTELDDEIAPLEMREAGAVPALPADAPKSVTFGVILFSYDGAQSAPKNARSKSAALEAAKRLVADAQKDFSEAVKRGDAGSTDNAGSMPRGILEPEIEYALFMLKKGEVYAEPIDTPRGYWILRRND